MREYTTYEVVPEGEGVWAIVDPTYVRWGTHFTPEEGWITLPDGSHGLVWYTGGDGRYPVVEGEDQVGEVSVDSATIALIPTTTLDALGDDLGESSCAYVALSEGDQIWRTDEAIHIGELDVIDIYGGADVEEARDVRGY